MKWWYHSKLCPCSAMETRVFLFVQLLVGLFSLHCWDATGLFMLSAGIALICAQYHAAFLVAVKETWVRAAVTLWHYHEFLTLCELSMCLWVQDCWTLTSCWYFTLDDVGQLFWRHHQSYNLVPATIVGFPLAKRTPYVRHYLVCRVFGMISEQVCQTNGGFHNPSHLFHLRSHTCFWIEDGTIA